MWIAAMLVACGGPPAPRPTVALVREAPEADRAALDAAITDAASHLPVILEARDVPASSGGEVPADPDFAAVRTAYDDGELERCLAALPDDAAVAAALERGDRIVASRASFWRMACLRALGRVDEAMLVAHDHAVRALPFPPDLGAANATAETMLRDAHRDVSAAQLARVRVTSDPLGASIAIDGAPTGETTPADVSVPPGAHLVTLALATYATRSTEVIVGAETPPLSFALAPLEPEAAAAALHAALVDGVTLDADVSLALLATALRARSLVLVSRDADRLRASLIGTADADGARAIVRGERVGEHVGDVDGLLRDVLVRARLAAPAPAFYELPEVWITVAAAIAIGVGVGLGIAFQPEPVTRVVLP
jgi:hypothetical protein